MPKMKTAAPNPVRKNTDIQELMSQIPTEVFASMVTKSGLAPVDQRTLIVSFKKMKGE